MASLRRTQGGNFIICFRYQGKQHQRALKTKEPDAAKAAMGKVEHTVYRLTTGDLVAPHGVDVGDYIVWGDAAKARADFLPAAAAPSIPSVAELIERYLDGQRGLKADSSLLTERCHLNNLKKVFGPKAQLPAGQVQDRDLDGLLQRRLGEAERATVKKERQTIVSLFKWAVRQKLLPVSPAAELPTVQSNGSRPQFRTVCEIEEMLARGGLSDDEALEIWGCLFLTQAEIGDLLALVKERAEHDFIHPMFCLAAYTGMRRGEIVIDAAEQKARDTPFRREPTPAEAEEMNERSREAWAGPKRHAEHVRPAHVNPVPDEVTPAQEDASKSPPPAIHSFDPLGVGIDVQGAIALGRPDRPSLQLYRADLEEIRKNNRDRYRTASNTLHEDRRTHQCFEWTDDPGSGHDKGIPCYRRPQFQAWLRKAVAELSDSKGLPVAIPKRGGKPHPDPEQWGVWPGSDRSLRAWRDLERSARLDRDLDNLSGQAVRPTFEIVPVVRSQGPNLEAIRSLKMPVFRPEKGCEFAVISIPLLTTYCFAEVHRRALRNATGRLGDYLLASDDPVGLIAGELYAESMLADHDPSPIGDEPPHPRDEDPERTIPGLRCRFEDLEANDAKTYKDWRSITEILLDVIPLGLSVPQCAVFIEGAYGRDDLPTAKLERLTRILVKKVFHGMRDFFHADMRRTLATVLGLPTADAIRLFTKTKSLQTSDETDTTDASLINDLLKKQKRRRSKVWRFIDSLRLERPDLPSDDEIADQVLNVRARTPAGRVVGPVLFSEARRQQVLLMGDELMKAMAYALTARGHQVIAMTRNQLVLQLPIGQVSQELLDQVIGSIPYFCEVTDEW